MRTKEVSRYVTIFGKDAGNELAKLHRLDVEEETEQICPISCPRCGYQEKREAHFYSRCGQAMRVEGATDVREIEEYLKRDYRDTEPGEATQNNLNALDALLDDPEVRSALLEKWTRRRRRHLSGNGGRRVLVGLRTTTLSQPVGVEHAGCTHHTTENRSLLDS